MQNKTKIYIIYGIFALISLALVVFLIFPLIMAVSNASQKILFQKSAGKFIDIQNSELDSFKKNYTSYQSNLEKADKMFVGSQDPVDFIKFLEDTAFESEVKAEISLSLNANDSKLKKADFISFNIACQGAFADILRFYEKLEFGPYLIEIQKMDIQKATKQVKSNLLINVFTK